MSTLIFRVLVHLSPVLGNRWLFERVFLVNVSVVFQAGEFAWMQVWESIDFDGDGRLCPSLSLSWISLPIVKSGRDSSESSAVKLGASPNRTKEVSQQAGIGVFLDFSLFPRPAQWEFGE